MIVNGRKLVEANPLSPMLTSKEREHGVSHGLAEAGYDIRIRQEVRFGPGRPRFQLASSLERFHMPDFLVGVVHDKSTWIRRGLSVFNTVIEPKWEGGLTLELCYHGNEELIIPAGAGIAQVIFHMIMENAAYSGKYQNQSMDPTPAILE